MAETKIEMTKERDMTTITTADDLPNCSFTFDCCPERDWLEDAGHENGNYFCTCGVCGCTFIGHKRRVICKPCSKQEPELHQAVNAESPQKPIDAEHPPFRVGQRVRCVDAGNWRTLTVGEEYTVDSISKLVLRLIGSDYWYSHYLFVEPPEPAADLGGISPSSAEGNAAGSLPPKFIKQDRKVYVFVDERSPKRGDYYRLIDGTLEMSSEDYFGTPRYIYRPANADEVREAEGKSDCDERVRELAETLVDGWEDYEEVAGRMGQGAQDAGVEAEWMYRQVAAEISRHESDELTKLRDQLAAATAKIELLTKLYREARGLVTEDANGLYVSIESYSADANSPYWNAHHARISETLAKHDKELGE